MTLVATIRHLVPRRAPAMASPPETKKNTQINSKSKADSSSSLSSSIMSKDKDDLDNTQHRCSLAVVGIFELLPLFGGLDDVGHLLRCAWLLLMLDLKRFKLPPTPFLDFFSDFLPLKLWLNFPVCTEFGL